MSRKENIIIVIDLELNQPSEKIIELGYVIGNPNTNEVKCEKSILVNPQENLDQEIINLTGITQDMVDFGTTLPNAYDQMVDDFKKFKALPIIHQWGVPDTNLLKQQLNDPEVWIFGRRWIDIKALAQASMIINGQNFYGGLKRIGTRLGLDIPNVGSHRAGFDARQAFLIYSYLAKKFLKNLPPAISANKSPAPAY